MPVAVEDPPYVGGIEAQAANVPHDLIAHEGIAGVDQQKAVAGVD